MQIQLFPLFEFELIDLTQDVEHCQTWTVKSHYKNTAKYCDQETRSTTNLKMNNAKWLIIIIWSKSK